MILWTGHTIHTTKQVLVKSEFFSLHNTYIKNFHYCNVRRCIVLCESIINIE